MGSSAFSHRHGAPPGATALPAARGLTAALRALALVPLLALVSPEPSQAQAQRDSERALSLRVGGALGIPSDFYRGVITTWEQGASGPGSRTRYTERMVEARTYYSELRYAPGSRSFVFVRAGFGGADTEAFFAGSGGGMEVIPRRLTWREYGAGGGLVLSRFSSFDLAAYAGWMGSSWRLHTSGNGRDELVMGPALNGDSMTWSDRSGPGGGVMVGTALQARLTPRWSTELRVEHRAARQPQEYLRIGDAEDIMRHTGQAQRIRYSSFRSLVSSISLSISYSPFREVIPDPAVRAVHALTERDDADIDIEDWTSPFPPEVRAALERGDTARAVAGLESAVRAAPDDAVLVGGLGVLLALSSTRAARHADRRRAEQLLERALRLDPRNPRYFIALGQVLEKRGFGIDARRVLTRAISAAAERPDAISPGELAEALYRRARAVERQVVDLEGLKLTGATTPLLFPSECAGVGGAFCTNWSRPREFFEHFAALGDASAVSDERRAGMLADLRHATELAPGHRDAWWRLLAAHARVGEWADFERVAAGYSAASPDDPWSALAAAAALHWAGEGQGADSLFRSGLARLGEADRRVFEDLRPLLPPSVHERLLAAGEEARARQRDLYWASHDPLYLSGTNEWRNEHRARVALAEILFTEPESEVRGPATPRGDILIRYGRPATVWQLRRDDAQLQQARAGGMELGGGPGGSGGGRWIFWNYSPESPSFIFEKMLGFTRVPHMSASISQAAAEEARRERPTGFDPPFRDAGPVTHQLARFRGEQPGTHDVEIHGRIPVAGMGVEPGDTIVRGLTLFQDGAASPVEQRSVREPAAAGAFSYRIVLPAGSYRYALEAATEPLDAAATARGSVVVGAYSPARLRLSDLLVAGGISPTSERPRSRRELRYEPLRCLAMPADGRLGVVFEIYGLADDEGLSRFRVELTLADEERPGLGVRILRGLGLQRREEPGTITYERVVEAGERALEWLELELPERPEGEVSVTVTITDLADGESASVSRALGARGC